jgi:hypothetical protein
LVEYFRSKEAFALSNDFLKSAEKASEKFDAFSLSIN